MTTPLEEVTAIAVQAGALLAGGYGVTHHAARKSSAVDLVTEYDARSEELIVRRLGASFPGDAILAEEGGLSGRAAERRWLVDPLDGTTNFAHGLPIFCVSIALESHRGVELGVVHAPALGLTFAAERGCGATCNGQPLRVADTADLAGALLATGFPADRQTSADDNLAQFRAFQKLAQGVRRMGSAAIDLAFVARGGFAGFWEMKLKPWDLGAGVLLVTEAGGRVSSWTGGPLVLERGAIVATNGRLHDAMLAVLLEAGIPSAARD